MNSHRALLLAAATAIALAATASAAAVTAASRITAATIYPDRAVLTRSATVELPSGVTDVVFENLPAALMDDSIQVSGRGRATATILEVTPRTTFVEAVPDPRVKSLQDDIRGLREQVRANTDRAVVLEQQRDLVRRINAAATTPAPAPRDGAQPPRPTIDEWKQLMAFSDDSFSKISTELQSLETARQDLKDRITALENQLNELIGQSGRGRSLKTVTVRLSATQPGRLDLTLIHAIGGASWSPSYDARLISAERSVELTAFGVVRNATGEDWNDIALSLSTARPSLGGAAPELSPWILDVFQPVLLEQARAKGMAMARMQAVAPSAPAAAMDEVYSMTGGAGEPEDKDAALMMAGLEGGLTSATFNIPAAATIPGDNTPRKIGITTAKLPARLQYDAAPKLSETAFLSAHTTNSTDFPLLAGPMNTFLDDRLIATSSLKTVMPGEKLELALGADEGIAIKRRLVNRFAEDTGLGNRGRRITYEILVTVQNNKNTIERVVLREPTPVSRNEKIVVKLLAPDEKDVGTPDKMREVTREEDGRLVWRLDLKAGEKREVPLKFSVEHPANVVVTGLE